MESDWQQLKKMIGRQLIERLSIGRQLTEREVIGRRQTSRES